MKGRESGMPEETRWATFFDVPKILEALEFDTSIGKAVEFGSGYGTFSIPAAKLVSDSLIAFDIEAGLIDKLNQDANRLQLPIRATVRDFVEAGTGLPTASVDYVMVFNILHIEDPVALLGEAVRILKIGGKVGIIHWNYDPATPRGPSMDIRPKSDDCINWAKVAGLTVTKQIDLPPYHYGIVCAKKEKP